MLLRSRRRRQAKPETTVMDGDGHNDSLVWYVCMVWYGTESVFSVRLGLRTE